MGPGIARSRFFAYQDRRPHPAMTERYEPGYETLEERIAGRLSSGDLPVVSPGADPAERALVDALHLLRTAYVTPSVMPDREASSRMLAGLRAAMEREAARQTVLERLWARFRPVLSRPAWALAAAAVVVVLSVVVLRPGDRGPVLLAESTDEILTVQTADGSTVTLRPHSVLEALEGPDGRSFRLTGEAWFSVRRDESRPFTVTAGDGLVTVLGTRFTVSTWSGAAAVFVDEGRVRFAGLPSGTSLELAAGEGAELVAGVPERSAGGGRDAAMDWMEGGLVLDSQPLGLILREVGHHFGIEIILPDRLAEESLSGRILLRDRRQALADLAVVVGGRFVETGPDAYRFEPE